MKFCKVADIEDWQQPEFQEAASHLKLKHKVRKTWEFIQVYNGLKDLGLLNGNAKAIGLGVGNEPLIYAFTNVCQSIVATDLYDSQTWATASMATQQVYEQNRFPYDRDRLTVRHMDMTKIDYPDASFDFVWSCCAIEHVNNFQELHQVFAEIHRVLKPGGIAALTTEFNPTDLHSYEPNMLFTDADWIDHWLTGEHSLIQGFELVDAIDFAINDHPGNQLTPRRQGRSIRAITRDIALTSISFFLRKTGAFSQPYQSGWLAPEINQYLAGCDAQRSQDFYQAEKLLRSLIQPQFPARLRVAASHRLATTLYAQRKIPAVIKLCRAGLADFEQDQCSDHLMPLASLCQKVWLWQEANCLYQQIVQLPGAHAQQVRDCFFYIGIDYEISGQFDQAIAAYQQAIDLSPQKSQIYIDSTQNIIRCKHQQKNPLFAVWRRTKAAISRQLRAFKRRRLG